MGFWNYLGLAYWLNKLFGKKKEIPPVADYRHFDIARDYNPYDEVEAGDLGDEFACRIDELERRFDKAGMDWDRHEDSYSDNGNLYDEEDSLRDEIDSFREDIDCFRDELDDYDYGFDDDISDDDFY